ncbi:MAG TPA: hypothetical protein VF989_00465 [Polyangiaceae bacterium]
MTSQRRYARRRYPWSILLVASAASLSGCAEQYCQSGPKYGTQCYTINEVEWQETQVRSEPPPAERSYLPSPGCVLVGTQGTVRQPLPNAAGGAPPGVPPGLHLLSGACVSRRVTAHGAVR